MFYQIVIIRNAIASRQAEEFTRRTNDWYVQVHKEGDRVIGDLNHLYQETHAPLVRQIAKELEAAMEAKAK